MGFERGRDPLLFKIIPVDGRKKDVRSDFILKAKHRRQPQCKFELTEKCTVPPEGAAHK